MKIIEQKDNKIKFTAEIDENLANAIRRYLNRIPVLAIDELEISKNDSPLYDETIAHRIGLIPLKMKKSLKEDSIIKLDLNSKKEGMVYSGELSGDIDVVYDKIPITSLGKGQEVKMVATAKMGKGIEHSKFSPGLIFYRNVAEIKVGKKCPKEVVDICPKKVFELQGDKIVVKNGLACDMCNSCVELCEKKGKEEEISVDSSKELIITAESWGQLEIKDMIEKTIDILKKDLKEISKKF